MADPSPTARRLLIAAEIVAATVAGSAVIQGCDRGGAAATRAPATTALAAPITTDAAPRTPTPPTSATASARGKSEWAGNGVLSVGDHPSGGAMASIPPGRYTITVTDPALEAAAVVRCSALPCSNSQNFLGGDSGFGADYTSVIDILPTDGAVRLINATLTAVR
ncbi:hypothetical protein [Nocardia cyriacigeorgica]|uniref:hypothetical protein n=1 Tax=Nocardia cyriacigeorgica TaxID=135487 RepID=UPI002458A2EA|nr:hypothetical protein [Nocardia cyriacigeorgica]